jgi:hypothetical protein
MRVLSYLLSMVFILLVSAVSGQNKVANDFLIQEGKVGKVEINMPVDKLNSIYSKDQLEIVTLKEEGTEYMVYKVFTDDKKKASFEIETLCVDICMVSRITIFSEKFKTAKDISVGSTIGDLKKNYTITSVIGSESGAIIIYVEEFSQVGFVVKIPNVTSFPGQKLEKTVVPETTIIESIYMF